MSWLSWFRDSLLLTDWLSPQEQVPVLVLAQPIPHPTWWAEAQKPCLKMWHESHEPQARDNNPTQKLKQTLKIHTTTTADY